MANTRPVFIDPARDADYKRGIFNAIIAPRPIGWISTVDGAGQANLAPFSYFNIVSNLPPILMFSCNTPEDRQAKDTLANVRLSGEFVFNLVGADQVAAMNDTSTPVPYEVDEFEYCGIEKAPCRFVTPPRVAASPCSLECKVLETIAFGGGDLGPQTHVTFGQVVGMHIAPGFLHEDGHFDTLAARPVSRLGGAEYSVTEDSFVLTRKFTRANEATY
ncbi:MAG: flavin reductase family protein [Novosphingobium sp.]|nr:flavin reductase family protein [Novosphingobium sp.]